MSEWGLIIFGLLILNLGLFFVQRLQSLYLETGRQVLAPKGFDFKDLFQLFFKILLILALIFLFAMLFFGYQLMPFDGPGSVLTALLLAYFFQRLT